MEVRDLNRLMFLHCAFGAWDWKHSLKIPPCVSCSEFTDQRQSLVSCKRCLGLRDRLNVYSHLEVGYGNLVMRDVHTCL